MNKEIVLIAETVSNQKGVDIDVVFAAIQAAIEEASRRRSNQEIGVRVVLDKETGDYQTYQWWDVLSEEDIEEPAHQLTLQQALELDSQAEIGKRIEQNMESIEFGRIDAQTAKQIIFQKVREAERDLVVQEYQARLGQLVTGLVKKTTRDNIILDFGGKAEALLPRPEILPHENYRPGDKVRVLLAHVEAQPRGPQLFVSRTCPEMLIELFRIEVPEVGEGIIEIKSAARDPGNRAKIAVKTNDGRIDPVGACVGMRGSRVQAVSSELGGERVDIILWDDNPAQLVINAMAPAEISSIVVDEERHTMDLAVKSEQLSQAIGRGGLNVRLATDLTGWTLNVMTEEEFQSKNDQESQQVMQLFVDQLEIDESVAEVLAESGFTSVEELAYMPAEELLAIEEFDEEIVEMLRNCANDVLLKKALADVEKYGGVQPAEDLLTLEGMDKDLAYLLASKGIVTMEDLAEQAVDDLLEITDIDRQHAADLIMKARAPWFE
ncbi:MAG: transcription termination/antitermination protein NusA [Legionellales bacterium]|nr:transcription termination/antitermination protein NusA [Legionellales bacterium]